jgi:anti-anti-sigma factor
VRFEEAGMHHNEASDLAATTAVIKMSGKFDFVSVEPLANRLAQELHRGRTQLVLDMADVEALSGGALGALLLQQTDAERLGGTIKIAGTTSSVYQTLKSNGFTSVFEIYETTDAAVRSFEQRSEVA